MFIHSRFNGALAFKYFIQYSVSPKLMQKIMSGNPLSCGWSLVIVSTLASFGLTSPVQAGSAPPSGTTSASESIKTINTGVNAPASVLQISPQQIQNLTNVLQLTAPLPQNQSGSGVSLGSGSVTFTGTEGSQVTAPINTNIPLPGNTSSDTIGAASTRPSAIATDRVPLPSTSSVDSAPLITFLKGSDQAPSVPVIAKSLIVPVDAKVASSVNLDNTTANLSEELAASVKGILASDTLSLTRLNSALTAYNKLVKEMRLISSSQLENFPQLERVGFVLSSLQSLAARS